MLSQRWEYLVFERGIIVELCKSSKEEKMRRFLNGTLNQTSLDLSSCEIGGEVFDIMKALETDMFNGIGPK